jgi:hypothetical protein
MNIAWFVVGLSFPAAATEMDGYSISYFPVEAEGKGEPGKQEMILFVLFSFLLSQFRKPTFSR